MVDLKNLKIKGEEAEVILQNRKWFHYVPSLLANLICENKMVSAGFGFGIHKGFSCMELVTMITRAQQQRNATATQLDSSDFFVLRLEEYERTLSVLITRIEESYAQEINLLNELLCTLNELRCHFQGIAEESERDMDWFEELATQPIVTITRNNFSVSS